MTVRKLLMARKNCTKSSYRPESSFSDSQQFFLVVRNFSLTVSNFFLKMRKTLLAHFDQPMELVHDISQW
jgi:hypothetical protein